MSNRILVPIDGSDPSFKAVKFAAEHHPDSHITVLHVVSPSEGLVGSGDAAYISQETIDAAISRGEKICEDAQQRIEATGSDATVTVESAVRIGRPTSTIIEFAEADGTDHIVIGSHGRSGVKRILLGSVAETVVRRADIPVTVVR